MASITIRNLSDDAKERLRARSTRRGRSLEAEARDLLERAAQSPDDTEVRDFPYDLVALVEPGEDIEPHIRMLRKPLRETSL